MTKISKKKENLEKLRQWIPLCMYYIWILFYFSCCVSFDTCEPDVIITSFHFTNAIRYGLKLKLILYLNQLERQRIFIQWISRIIIKTLAIAWPPDLILSCIGLFLVLIFLPDWFGSLDWLITGKSWRVIPKGISFQTFMVIFNLAKYGTYITSSSK